MMTRYIIIRTQFAATHNYPEANNYLKYKHRHVFYVTMKWEVQGNNRDIEFIQRKEKVETFIAEHYANKFINNLSCEDIAELLMKRFNAHFVSVFEDNENGAEIINYDESIS